MSYFILRLRKMECLPTFDLNAQKWAYKKTPYTKHQQPKSYNKAFLSTQKHNNHEVLGSIANNNVLHSEHQTWNLLLTITSATNTSSGYMIKLFDSKTFHFTSCETN